MLSLQRNLGRPSGLVPVGTSSTPVLQVFRHPACVRGQPILPVEI